MRARAAALQFPGDDAAAADEPAGLWGEAIAGAGAAVFHDLGACCPHAPVRAAVAVPGSAHVRQSSTTTSAPGGAFLDVLGGLLSAGTRGERLPRAGNRLTVGGHELPTPLIAGIGISVEVGGGHGQPSSATKID